MRAVVIHAPRDLRIDSFPDPAPGPGEVRVKIEAAVMVVVQVRATDAARLDLDPHLARAGSRIRKAVDAQIPGRMNDHGTHQLVLPVSSCPPILHRRQHAAIDIDGLAVDIGRGLGGQEDRGADEFVRTAPALGRDTRH